MDLSKFKWPFDSILSSKERNNDDKDIFTENDEGNTNNNKNDRSNWTKRGWETRKKNKLNPEYIPVKKRPRKTNEELNKILKSRSKKGWDTRKKNGWKKPRKI